MGGREGGREGGKVLEEEDIQILMDHYVNTHTLKTLYHVLRFISLRDGKRDGETHSGEREGVEGWVIQV